MKIRLAIDTLNMALSARQRDGIPLAELMVFPNDASSQYRSFALTSGPNRCRSGRVGPIRQGRL